MLFQKKRLLANRRVDQSLEPEANLSFDQIVKNTWKSAMGGWNLGKRDGKENRELTNAEKRKSSKKKNKKKNPFIEMMMNAATKGATKYFMNQLGLEKKGKQVKKKKAKFDVMSSLWGVESKSEKDDKTEKHEMEDEDNTSAIMTLDLDELL